MIRFNDVEIDVDQFQIKVAGVVQAVEPKVFDLISYLIKHHQRIISRDELFQQIWSGRDVSDTTLSNHIKSARKVLGDNGESQSVIKTIRSRGYQFVADIMADAEQNSINSTTHVTSQSTNNSSDIAQHHFLADMLKRCKPRYILTALTVILVMSFLWFNTFKTTPMKQEPYILVVPFSISGINQSALTPFSDQVVREVIQALRKISAIKVVPPPSSFTFKANKQRSTIKQQLPSVDYVLDGVVSEGDNGNIRITVSLESLTSQALIWDGNYEVVLNSSNRFSLQKQIASSVSKSLKVIVLDDEIKTLSELPTTNLQAYDLYVLGQHQLSLFTHQSALKAIDYFKQAIALDAEFEAAIIAKASAYRIIMTLFDKPKDVLPHVVSSAIDIFSANPSSAYARSLLGLAYVHVWLWEDAWKMLTEANERDPNIALTHLGFALYYSAMGDIAGIKRSLAIADELDPLNEEIAEWGMWALMMVGELDYALKWGEVKAKLHPNKPYPMLSLAVGYYIQGAFEQSITLGEKAVELSNREPFPLVILAQAYAAAGHNEKVYSLVDEAKTKQGYVCPYESAVIYALLNEPTQIMPLLKEAVDYRSNCLIFMRNDPRFKQALSSDELQPILDAINLQNELVAGYPK